ncbi:MAG: hypothetical protein C3F02_03285 [Parcubacteria group bacterium]|nr:MAG: hypothetical protein C3F02_03285 [Parcubacteria group bacterium]
MPKFKSILRQPKQYSWFFTATIQLADGSTESHSNTMALSALSSRQALIDLLGLFAEDRILAFTCHRVIAREEQED